MADPVSDERNSQFVVQGIKYLYDFHFKAHSV